MGGGSDRQLRNDMHPFERPYLKTALIDVMALSHGPAQLSPGRHQAEYQDKVFTTDYILAILHGNS